MNTQFAIPASTAWKRRFDCLLCDFKASTSFWHSSISSSSSSSRLLSPWSLTAALGLGFIACKRLHSKFIQQRIERWGGEKSSWTYHLLTKQLVTVLIEKVIRFSNTLLFIAVITCTNESFHADLQEHVPLLFCIQIGGEIWFATASTTVTHSAKKTAENSYQ